MIYSYSNQSFKIHNSMENGVKRLKNLKTKILQINYQNYLIIYYFNYFLIVFIIILNMIQSDILSY